MGMGRRGQPRFDQPVLPRHGVAWDLAYRLHEEWRRLDAAVLQSRCRDRIAVGASGRCVVSTRKRSPGENAGREHEDDHRRLCLDAEVAQQVHTVPKAPRYSGRKPGVKASRLGDAGLIDEGRGSAARGQALSEPARD